MTVIGSAEFVAGHVRVILSAKAVDKAVQAVAFVNQFIHQLSLCGAEWNPPKAEAGPSRPDIKEVDNGPDEPPLKIQPIPGSSRLQLLLNKGSKLLTDAKGMRPKEEAPAVEFVFKYGLALTAMGLLDSAKKTPEWQADESGCRDRIEQTTASIARVIVPLCLSLPKKLPKSE